MLPPRTDRFEEEETSSLSDYDSEWTQVSGAEDDSDFPPLTAASDRPLSRADTFDGSVDGDIWEGFVDGIHRSLSQSSNQTRPSDVDIVDATDEAPQDSTPLVENAGSCDHEIETDNDALDSELVGTLTASRARSAAASLRASLTESQSKLRLSFPDPLSSREQLGADSDLPDTSAPPSSVEEHCENVTSEAVPSFAEVNAPLSPLDMDPADVVERPTLPHPEAPCVFSLHLYGSASSSKWQIAERIMKLILLRTDNAQSITEDGYSRDYYFNSTPDAATDATNYQPVFVRVLDRTSGCADAVCNHLTENFIYLTPHRNHRTLTIVYHPLQFYFFLPAFPRFSRSTIFTFLSSVCLHWILVPSLQLSHQHSPSKSWSIQLIILGRSLISRRKMSSCWINIGLVGF